MRPASAAEAPLLAAVDASAGRHPWKAGQLESAIERGAAALVADEDGAIRGFVLYSCVLDEATVLNIAVHRQSQGQGLGSSLLDTALEHMRTLGLKRCLLEVRASNVAALQLYRRAGFVTDGVRKHYYPADDGRENALLMSCTL